jgi:tetratricopeptide (TPR) repeat protein
VRWIAWSLLALATVAHAQTPGGSDADKLFEQGRALAKAGKYAEACDAFQHSFDLDHATGTELNLGDCHEQQGHWRRAWELYTAAAEDFERAGNAARSKFAHDRADAVASRLATIVVDVPQPQPKGLAITIAGRVVQPRPEIRELVNPGAVEITASAPDRTGFVTMKQAAGGQTVTVNLPVLAEVAVAATGPGPTVRRRSRVDLAWGLAGVSGASAIAGVAFTLVGRSHYNDAADGMHCMKVSGGVSCDTTGTNLIHDAQRLADYGTGFAIACGVLGASAAVVYLTAPRDTVVTPTATAQSVGVSVSGRF